MSMHLQIMSMLLLSCIKSELAIETRVRNLPKVMVVTSPCANKLMVNGAPLAVVLQHHIPVLLHKV